MAKTSISLATRNALVYFLLFLIGITVSNVLFLSYSSIEIHDLTDKRLKHTQEMLQLKFESYLDQIEDDVNQLSRSPLLQAYLENNDTTNLDMLHDEYASFLASKSTYFQIRLLATNTEGKELLRVERIDENIIRCPENELQYKGERDYFKELLQLPLDSIYYSKIDLNKENGIVSPTKTPTLRLGKKVKTLSGADCFLIANIDLTQLFDNLKALIPASHELRFFNQDGHYLIHPEPKKTFTFEANGDPCFFEEFEFNMNEITPEGVNHSTSNAVNIFFNLTYDRPTYNLFGGVSVKDEIVFASFYSWRRKMIMISILVALFFLITAFIYMRKQTKELKSITEELKTFSSKIKPKKIKNTRRDEIGELAESFEKMSQKVSESHLEMEKAKIDAEKANREKEEFLENMSHEIRNPLQSILGGVQILEQNQKSDYQKPFIASLKFNSQQLNSLVTDVLDFSKLKNGQIHLDKKWNDLKQFCADLVNASKYRADKKNISIQLDYSSSLDSFIFKFDPIRLYQILNNLLSNAVKFTPNGGVIQIKVSLIENNSIHFSVIDNGNGISKLEMQRLTQRKIGTNFNLGSGLGLAIVQDLLTIHDSQLSVYSEPDKGSKFSFNLSLEYKTKALNEIPQNPLDFSGKSHTRVLILEDDAELREWYRHVLLGFDIQLFASLSEFATSSQETFDFAICDLNFETSQLSKTEIDEFISPRLKMNGKIMIVSGSEKKEAFKAFTFFKKPLERDELVATLVNHQLFILHGSPDFSNFEKDYDQNKTLIKKALLLLIASWEKDKEGLIGSINNKSIEEFQKIKHRIITSIRRLNLTSFEDFLDQLEPSAANQTNELLLLNEKMDFYISKMIAYIED